MYLFYATATKKEQKGRKNKFKKIRNSTRNFADQTWKWLNRRNIFSFVYQHAINLFEIFISIKSKFIYYYAILQYTTHGNGGNASNWLCFVLLEFDVNLQSNQSTGCFFWSNMSLPFDSILSFKIHILFFIIYFTNIPLECVQKIMHEKNWQQKKRIGMNKKMLSTLRCN